jgi:protein SCO1/2
MKVILIILIQLLGLAAFSQSSSILESNYTWKDSTDKEFKISDYKGKRLVLTMSYTACKKTCPLLTMKVLKEISVELEKRKLSAEFIVFSFDPEHDTPAVLAEFVNKQKLNLPNWHFVTGSKQDTRAIAKTLGLANYWEMDDHILHDFKVTIISPDGNKSKILDWDKHSIEGIDL